MQQILDRIASAGANKDEKSLKRLRLALTDHLPISNYAALLPEQISELLSQVNALLNTTRKCRDNVTNATRNVAVRVVKDVVKLDLSTLEQSDLFADESRWPRRPYCTDDLAAGLRIRSLRSALLHPYISANPPHLRIWTLFDIDRAGAAGAWETAGLPPPAWTAINKKNGHAHSAWGLTAPVLVEGLGARDAPMRYLCAVESMMREKLQADHGFAGLITKNPAHPLWQTLRGPRMTYDLAELAAALPGIEKYKPRGRVEAVGLGRNVTLFDALRKWSYKGIRAYWGGGLQGWNAWLSASNNRALTINADLFGGRLLEGREVWHIAKSVAKWTWANTTSQGFSKWQAAQGRRGGLKSGAVRWKGSVSKKAPWIAEGVSRATWYRHESGLIVPVNKADFSAVDK